MKKISCLILSLMFIMTMLFTGCGKPDPEAAVNEDTGTEVTETTDGAISLRVDTEGMGQIAYAEEGEEPEFNDEFPKQSAVENLEEPATRVLGAKADDGWKFVKWTKDGEDFSEDEQITVEIDRSTEFVAVFDVSE